MVNGDLNINSLMEEYRESLDLHLRDLDFYMGINHVKVTGNGKNGLKLVYDDSRTPQEMGNRLSLDLNLDSIPWAFVNVLRRDKDLAGKGVGRNLYHAGESFLKKQGFKAVGLECRSEYRKAFWQSVGFEPVVSHKNLMRKKLH